MAAQQVRTLPTPLSLSDFDVGVTLGTGSFGRVRFSTHKTTGSYWAIKMLKKAEVIRLQQVEHMISEKKYSFKFGSSIYSSTVWYISRRQVFVHGTGVYRRW